MARNSTSATVSASEASATLTSADFNLNAHVNVHININDADYSWRDPQGEKTLELRIPVIAVSVMDLQTLILNTVVLALEDYRAKVAEAEAEAARAQGETVTE